MAIGEISLAKTEPVSWRRYYELTKPKVVMLILFTALVGMLLAAPGLVPWDTLVFGLLGIGLAAAAGAVVNHVVDQHIDVVMERTRGRPLPSGRMDAPHAIAFALVLATLAMIVLMVWVNALTAGYPEVCKCPAHFPNDRTAIEKIIVTCGKLDPGDCSIIRIRNTMKLDQMLVSENLLGELAGEAEIDVTGPPAELGYDGEGNLAPLRF